MLSDNTRNLLISHCKKYSKLQPQDLFKFLYQSAFGCEHMVSSLDNVIKNIKLEFDNVKPNDEPIIEELDGKYCRVPLSFINTGVSSYKIGELFYMSAQKEPDGLSKLLNNIEIAKCLVSEKLLPFELSVFETALSEWKRNDYQPLHHSDIYREEYHPSYRVVAKEYVPLLFQPMK